MQHGMYPKPQAEGLETGPGTPEGQSTQSLISGFSERLCLEE